MENSRDFMKIQKIFITICNCEDTEQLQIALAMSKEENRRSK